MSVLPIVVDDATPSTNSPPRSSWQGGCRVVRPRILLRAVVSFLSLRRPNCINTTVILVNKSFLLPFPYNFRLNVWVLHPVLTFTCHNNRPECKIVEVDNYSRLLNSEQSACDCCLWKLREMFGIGVLLNATIHKMDFAKIGELIFGICRIHMSAFSAWRDAGFVA